MNETEDMMKARCAAERANAIFKKEKDGLGVYILPRNDAQRPFAAIYRDIEAEETVGSTHCVTLEQAQAVCAKWSAAW